MPISEILGNDVYGSFEAVARQRLDRRDPDDWPDMESQRGHPTSLKSFFVNHEILAQC
jgi:hypothetical protein